MYNENATKQLGYIKTKQDKQQTQDMDKHDIKKKNNLTGYTTSQQHHSNQHKCNCYKIITHVPILDT